MDLEKFFFLQRDLQLKMSPVGRDPGDIEDPEEKIQFIKDMVLATTDELHEALNEVGWKPWATSLHINREAYLSELVDAFHFLMNLFLVVNVSADEVTAKYLEKRQRNIDRQVAGYDGVKGKCPECRRDYADSGVLCILPIAGGQAGWCDRDKCFVTWDEYRRFMMKMGERT